MAPLAAHSATVGASVSSQLAAVLRESAAAMDGGGEGPPRSAAARQAGRLPSQRTLPVRAAVAATAVGALAALVGVASAAPAQSSSPYTRCTGQSGRVDAGTWAEVRDVQGVDTEGRKFGMALDHRSDSLQGLWQMLNEEVLVDLDGAVQDCVFGVLSLLYLTLPLVDALEGIERARASIRLADQLTVQFSELLAQSDWPPELGTYAQHRQLLGFQRHNCEGTSLRIFVYSSTPDLTLRRLWTGTGMMGAGSHFHAFFESGSCTTEDPDKADLFLMPAYHGDQYDEFLEVRSHWPNVSELFPYLSRRRGTDHFFVVAANLPSWPHLEPLRNTMMLTVESYQVNDGVARWYSPWKDVMIPGYIDRWRIASMRKFNKPTHERGYTMVFHGNHPGTHHLYVKFNASVRTQILDSFTGIPDCSVGGPTQDFFDRMGRSHFCLVPRGSSAWTIHLYESFFFGCIPVILSDHFEMPFQDLVDWPSLSIKWPMDDIGPKLLEYLRAIPLDRVAEMKRNLEAAACYFDYHSGWAPQPEVGSLAGWSRWGDGVVALGSDCPYVSHGDGADVGACRASCEGEARCNLVNFRAGDCILRRCADLSQPSLTGSAPGFEVWARTPSQQPSRGCSPYAGVLQALEARARARPATHGAHWL
mmetsp:Transcript_109827/g.354339  ORF Transcript_109827/g.354339 Transcript_109827/m.354339 type:complete len:646 (+) Transcript_109827:63-2000(+)